jgi:6-pyruvoyl-tetrahydropterin synthase
MPVTIEKTFRFDAGHRALGFKERKEESLHGHTWVRRLVIETGRLAEWFFKAVKERLQLHGAVLKRADLDATATLRASYSE